MVWQPYATPVAGWDLAAFGQLHLTAQSPHWLVGSAVVIAQWMPALVAVLTVWQLIVRRNRRVTLLLVAAWLVSFCIEALFNRYAFHPRPFAVGLGPAWLHHAANNSMPSSHVTVALLLVFALLINRSFLSAVVALGMTIMLAWARIAVGIHWPSDMLGSGFSAAASYGLVLAVEWGLRQAWRARRNRIHRSKASASHS